MLLVKRKWSPLASSSLKLFQVCVARQDDLQVPEGIDSPTNKKEIIYSKAINEFQSTSFLVSACEEKGQYKRRSLSVLQLSINKVLSSLHITKSILCDKML